MTETKAVMLGFGAVAFVMLAVPAGMLLSFIIDEPPAPAHLDELVSRLFLLAQRAHPSNAGSVPEIRRLLSSGTTATSALGTLGASDFRCERDTDTTRCTRTLRQVSARTEWRVTFKLDARGQVQAADADWRDTSL